MFQDTGGDRYVIEVTRLELDIWRDFDSAIRKHITRRFDGELCGTFLLKARVTPTIIPIAKKVAPSIIHAISDLAKSGENLVEEQQIDATFSVSKVREDGSRIVPWIMAPRLPYDLDEAHPEGMELKSKFDQACKEAQSKFENWDGRRVID